MNIVEKVDKALEKAGIKVTNGKIAVKDRAKALEITFKVMKEEGAKAQVFIVQSVEGDNIGWSIMKAMDKEEALEMMAKKKIKGKHKAFTVKEYTKHFGQDAYNAIEPNITHIKNFEFLGWD
jgi:hypothetical protein